jgi:hypothetical protein
VLQPSLDDDVEEVRSMISGLEDMFVVVNQGIIVKLGF